MVLLLIWNNKPIDIQETSKILNPNSEVVLG